MTLRLYSLWFLDLFDGFTCLETFAMPEAWGSAKASIKQSVSRLKKAAVRAILRGSHIRGRWVQEKCNDFFTSEGFCQAYLKPWTMQYYHLFLYQFWEQN